MIDIRATIPNLRTLRALNGRAVVFAEVQALNRTRNNVQSEGVKAVADAMGIKPSKLRKRGSGTKGNAFGAMAKGRNANRRRLETSVIGRGRPFNVSRWLVGELKQGARVWAVTHDAYGRQQTATNVWRLKNGAVVVQSGNSFRGVFGPGVTQMMERKDIAKELEQVAIEQFPRHFKAAIEFAFSPGAPAFLR